MVGDDRWHRIFSHLRAPCESLLFVDRRAQHRSVFGKIGDEVVSSDTTRAVASQLLS